VRMESCQKELDKLGVEILRLKKERAGAESALRHARTLLDSAKMDANMWRRRACDREKQLDEEKKKDTLAGENIVLTAKLAKAERELAEGEAARWKARARHLQSVVNEVASSIGRA
jgi:chromosome segregation ATPase